MRTGAMSVNGRVPPDAIQHAMPTDSFRACYDAGLKSNAKLAGAVTVKFVIDESGKVVVSSVSSDSNLPDSSVSSCVAASVCDVSFPKPASGITTVVYPVTFRP